MAFTIHASRDTARTQTIRISPVNAVARARALSEAGWRVHITGPDGRDFQPEHFDELLDWAAGDGPISYAASAKLPPRSADR
jgi:hypothetical protein